MTPLEVGLLVWAVLATLVAVRYRRVALASFVGWKAAIAGWKSANETLARAGQVMEEEGAALAAIQEAIDNAQSAPLVDAHEIRKDLMN